MAQVLPVAARVLLPLLRLATVVVLLSLGCDSDAALPDAGPVTSIEARMYNPLLDDPVARPFAHMVGYHGYDRTHFEAIAALRERYPDLPIWMTELCCLRWQEQTTAWADGETWGTVILADLAAGANAWIYLNMILDQNGGPWIESRIHNFVRPGATRIDVSPSTPDAPAGVGLLSAIAFENATGSTALVLLSRADTASEVQIDADGRSMRASLPPHSVATILW